MGHQGVVQVTQHRAALPLVTLNRSKPGFPPRHSSRFFPVKPGKNRFRTEITADKFLLISYL